jgi:hypothetical protein
MHIKVAASCKGLENVEHIINGVKQVSSLLDLNMLGVWRVVLAYCHDRGFYRRMTVVLNPHTKSFQLNYKGYQYKRFGGRKDLTPAGVFAHECGHALWHHAEHGFKVAFGKVRKANPKSITWYGSSCITEDVAETFRLYVSNPTYLRSIDPERYRVVHKYASMYMKEAHGHE